MENILQQFVVMIQNFVESNNILLSVSVGMSSIIIESIIPPLPLGLFIAINIIAFGNVIGFIISLLATLIGCSISFYLCGKLQKLIRKKLKKDGKIMAFIDKIDNIKFSNLCLILAMPFTPAFTVNIAAGLSKMEYKKYLLALIISKPFIVYFWGYVGSNVIVNITDISLMIRLALMVILIFIASKVVTNRYDL